jgi:alkylhydroperoxidase family enzyme
MVESLQQPEKDTSSRASRETVQDLPFLPPIENPPSFIMKIAYYFTNRQFGHVITPIKVFVARLPSAFGQFYAKIPKLDQKLTLLPETALLIRERVARLNVCLFCMDLNRWAVIKRESMNEGKFDAIEDYKTSPLFSEAERAALEYATQLTKEKKVDGQDIANLKPYFSERQICEIVWLVASEHFYNITNIGLNIHSDMLCQITGRK